jgi:predicted metallopeptidase
VQLGHEPKVDAGSQGGLRHARSACQQRRRAALYRKYRFNEEDRRSYYTVNGEDAFSMTTD